MWNLLNYFSHPYFLKVIFYGATKIAFLYTFSIIVYTKQFVCDLLEEEEILKQTTDGIGESGDNDWSIVLSDDTELYTIVCLLVYVVVNDQLYRQVH